ncbi:MAG: helix-turn-helix domain-containing protein [Planctomycetota bacterium]
MSDVSLPKLTYTKEEAAKILNVPESSINWQLRKGKLPYRKISGRVRFTLSDLKILVESSKVENKLY